jgi:putative ABC transport system permease protein
MTRERRSVRWLHRLGFGEPRPDESAALEVEHHIAELIDRLVAEGLDADEARRKAERHFGDRARYAAKMRRLEEASLRGDSIGAAIEILRQSLVSVARTARREPGFTAAVVLTLALGIGANATMYGIIDRLMLRAPEHIVEPDQVVRVYREASFLGEIRSTVLTYPDYAGMRAVNGFAAIAGYGPAQERTLGAGEAATRIRAALAAAELFPLLGVKPVIGRFYTPEEARPGSQPTVVLAYEYWRGAYGGDPTALGRQLEIGERSYTIVGVAPPAFTGVELQGVDAWLPLEMLAADNGCYETRNCVWLNAVARLARGVSNEVAAEEATGLVTAARAAAGVNADGRVVLLPLIAARGPEASAESRVARWLAGVSLIVLLIACANVANLLTARGTRRRMELGVRLALGAGRPTVVAHAVVETLLLALVGGALALAIAHWGGGLVRSTLFPDVYFPGSALTPRLVVFALVAATGAGLLAGIAPALHGTRVDAARLHEHGARATPRGSRLRAGLTVSQAAMTVVLLVGAGLFVRSIGEIRAVDMGLDVDRLVSVNLDLRGQYLDYDRETLVELHEDAARRVSVLPSVRAAAATSSGLSSNYTTRIRAQGVDSIPRLPAGGPFLNSVSPGYFETVGLAVLRGRGLDASDVAGGERVVVVSDFMARTLWPADDPLGQCLFVGTDATECTRVVGVVEDAARNGFQDAAAMSYYLPSSQTTWRPNTVYARADGSADDIVDDVAAALRGFSPDVRYVNVRPVRDLLDRQARSWIMGATMFTIFGLLALVVAMIGLYSVLAFDVAQRTREMGIRTALGARKARILRLVISQGAIIGGVGVSLGLGAAYVAAPYIQDLLFETSPRDPTVFVGVALVLLAVSVAASWIPALRATHVDPVIALKAD